MTALATFPHAGPGKDPSGSNAAGGRAPLRRASGDLHFHHRAPFEAGEGQRLQAIAQAIGLDEERAMDALLRAGAEGFVETNLFRWRAVGRTD